MNITQQELALAEGYVMGTLSSEEKNQAELLITSNPGFQDVIDQLKEVKEASRYHALLKKKRFLEKIESETPYEPPKSKNRRRNLFLWLSSAAAVLLIFLLLKPIIKETQPEIFADNIPQFISPVIRGSVSSIVDEAFSAYSYSNFKDAASAFEKAADAGNPLYFIHAAISWLRINKTNKAGLLLNKYEDGEADITRPLFIHTKALHLMRSEGNQAAFSYLDDLSNNSSFTDAGVQKLYNDLKKVQ